MWQENLKSLRYARPRYSALVPSKANVQKHLKQTAFCHRRETFQASDKNVVLRECLKTCLRQSHNLKNYSQTMIRNVQGNISFYEERVVVCAVQKHFDVQQIAEKFIIMFPVHVVWRTASSNCQKCFEQQIRH